MNRIYTAAYAIQQFCQTRGWSFCFIGGLAVQRWGQPRLTRDVDVTVLVEFGNEAEFIDTLLQDFSARIEDARLFALNTRVVLLRAKNHVALDVALGSTFFEERSIGRASWYQISPRRRLLTCSAEDLIVHKAFANRPQDWIDIDSILIRQGRTLRMAIIWEELTPLVALKEEPEILDRLRQLVADLLPRDVVE